MRTRELRCHKCNEYAPIDTMKYEKTGTHLICASCRGQKEEASRPRLRPLIDGPFGQPKTLKYQCASCRYMFRRSAAVNEIKCPSCGGAKLLRYEKLSADDILKMADDKRFERF